jgi:pantetheine-phosphate adenylyltransferase
VLFSKKSTSHLTNVQVIESRGLVARIAEKHGVRVLVRGIRSLSEFEYERQLYNINRRLSPKLDTIFFIASEGKSLISSSFVKELAKNDGDVKMFLPPSIFSDFMSKFRSEA